MKKFGMEFNICGVSAMYSYIKMKDLVCCNAVFFIYSCS